MSETTQPRELFCSFCQRSHAVDGAWWEMSYGATGALRIEPIDPATYHPRTLANYEALVCGQLGVITLTERYVQQRNFDPPTPELLPAVEMAVLLPVAQPQAADLLAEAALDNLT